MSIRFFPKIVDIQLFAALKGISIEAAEQARADAKHYQMASLWLRVAGEQDYPLYAAFKAQSPEGFDYWSLELYGFGSFYPAFASCIDSKENAGEVVGDEAWNTLVMMNARRIDQGRDLIPLSVMTRITAEGLCWG